MRASKRTAPGTPVGDPWLACGFGAEDYPPSETGRRYELRLARSEIKDLRRLLDRSGVPHEEISRSAPALLRCLAHRSIIATNIKTMMLLIGTVIFSGPLFVWVEYLKPDEKSLAFQIYYVMSLLLLSIMFKINAKYDEDIRRNIKYGKGIQLFIYKNTYIIYAILFTIGLMYAYMSGVFVKLNLRILLAVAAQVFLCLIYLWLISWTVRIILRWRVPQLVLVRALADAFETVTEPPPASWRRVHLRSKAAQYIDKAADTLEGPIARRFVASAGLGGAAIQERLLMAGAALRQKVAWLATPKEETREFLARALATELLIAAMGDLDRLEYAELGAAGSSAVGWLTRLRKTVGWAAVGFGPAIFVIVNNNLGEWATDPAKTGIFGQLAVVCFFLAVLSAADPTGYKERLGIITGTGTALFGWRKAEK